MYMEAYGPLVNGNLPGISDLLSSGTSSDV